MRDEEDGVDKVSHRVCQARGHIVDEGIVGVANTGYAQTGRSQVLMRRRTRFVMSGNTLWMKACIGVASTRYA